MIDIWWVLDGTIVLWFLGNYNYFYCEIFTNEDVVLGNKKKNCVIL